MSILSDREFKERIFEIAGEFTEEFKPFFSHNTDGDCIEFYISPDNYYGDRIDNFLTVYRNFETGEIVGFVIKNVNFILSRLSKNQPCIKLVTDNGKVRLRSLFVAMFFDEKIEKPSNDTVVGVYADIANVAESNKLDEVELLCS